MEANLREDLAELTELLPKVKSPRTLAVLERHQEATRAQLDGLARALPPPATAEAGKIRDEEPQAPKPRLAMNKLVESSAELRWQDIQTFAWDQTNKFVEVFVTAKGVGSLKADKVTCAFGETSIDLQIRGLDGNNLRLLKPNLSNEIVPGECKFKVKQDRVTLKLRKADGKFGPEHWTALVEKRKKPSSNSEDPTASLMGMMKDLYDSGDDEMKKTIGEAMLKSRQGGGE